MRGEGGRGDWGRGGFRTNGGRGRSFQGGDGPEPMDVVCHGSGEEVNTLATTTTVGRGGGGGGCRREDTTGMDFLRLMEAVLGTLAGGGGGGCDETSCAVRERAATECTNRLRSRRLCPL